ALRRILEVVGPRDVVALQQVEVRACDRLVAAVGWDLVARGQVPERGRGQEVRPVGERRAQERREEPIADRELARELVVEWDLVLVVETHGVVVSGRLDTAVRLLVLVVDPHEAVHRSVSPRVVGVIEVDLAVRAYPLVIEVRGHAAVRIVKRERGAAVIVEVCVRAVEVSGGVDLAAQTVDAAMIVRPAAAAVVGVAVAIIAMVPGAVIWAAWREREGTEVVVERMILL